MAISIRVPKIDRMSCDFKDPHHETCILQLAFKVLRSHRKFTLTIVSSSQKAINEVHSTLAAKKAVDSTEIHFASPAESAESQAKPNSIAINDSSKNKERLIGRKKSILQREQD